MLESSEDFNLRAKALSKLVSLNWSRNFEVLLKKEQITKGELAFFTYAKELLDKVYPGNYDFQLELGAKARIYTNTYGYNLNKEIRVLDEVVVKFVHIIIRFPKITITNSSNMSTEIKDLFVRIPIRLRTPSNVKQRLIMEEIEGTRTTISLENYMNGYCHSHLPSRDYKNEAGKSIAALAYETIQWENFCTGSGDINATRALFNGERTMDIFELMLHQIEEFVKWESLEGHPHIKMTTIFSGMIEDNLPKVDWDEGQSYFSDLKLKLTIVNSDIDISWEFRNGRYYIVDNDRFDKFLEIYLYPRTMRTQNSRWFLKDTAGKYYVNVNLPLEAAKQYPYWIPFKGEKLYFKVEEQSVDIRNLENRYYLHPKIKNYVKQRLEFYANYAKIRESGIRRLTESSNN